MSAKDFVWPVIEAADVLLSSELDYWRDEITRPWRLGRRGRAAEVARWIGVGLAVGAAAGGVLAALRSERPWE